MSDASDQVDQTVSEVVVRPARRARFDWTSWLGLALAGLIALAAGIGPSLATHDPNIMNLAERLQGPSQTYWLGTDQFGRDILSRLLTGARVSILVGLMSTLVGMLLGIAIGALAGYFGKWLDELLMRVIDITLCFPYIVLAILFVFLLGPSLTNLIIVIGITRVPEYARVSRSLMASIKELAFVDGARALGASQWRMVLRHIVPNGVTPIVVLGTLSLATAIRMEATLGFLGLGVPPPEPTWGGMISDGRRFVSDAPWITTFPGLAITLTILSFNLLGDSLRDALDRKSSRKSGARAKSSR